MKYVCVQEGILSLQKESLPVISNCDASINTSFNDLGGCVWKVKGVGFSGPLCQNQVLGTCLSCLRPKKVTKQVEDPRSLIMLRHNP